MAGGGLVAVTAGGGGTLGRWGVLSYSYTSNTQACTTRGVTTSAIATP